MNPMELLKTALVFRNNFGQNLLNQFRMVPSRCLSSVADVQPENAAEQLSHVNSARYLNKKSTGSLLRTLIVMKLCSRKIIVVNSEWLMNNSKRIMGKTLFNFILRNTFYKQFVIGETESEITSGMADYTAQNIKTMIMMGYENDLGLLSEEDYNRSMHKNQQELIKVIQLLENTNESNNIVHFKLTGFFPFSTLRKISEKISNQKDYEKIILAIKNIFTATGDIADSVLADLEASEIKYLSTGIEKLASLMEHTTDVDIKLLVDAEYTNMNEGINAITAAMLMVYNKSRPVVGFTFQCYLKNSMECIMRNVSVIQKHDLCWSCKFVRGAYIDSERKMSLVSGLPNPVHDSYEETNDSYDNAVKKLMSLNFSNKCFLMVATHNLTSIQKACKLLINDNKDSKSVVFGQLMGMSDNISLQLGSLQFLVYKTTPYGSMEETIPYLVRRVHENSSIFNGFKNEIPVIQKEFLRRLNPFSLRK